MKSKLKSVGIIAAACAVASAATVAVMKILDYNKCKECEEFMTNCDEYDDSYDDDFYDDESEFEDE